MRVRAWVRYRSARRVWRGQWWHLKRSVARLSPIMMRAATCTCRWRPTENAAAASLFTARQPSSRNARTRGRVCRKCAVVVQIGPVCRGSPACRTARWSAPTSRGSGMGIPAQSLMVQLNAIVTTSFGDGAAPSTNVWDQADGALPRAQAAAPVADHLVEPPQRHRAFSRRSPRTTPRTPATREVTQTGSVGEHEVRPPGGVSAHRDCRSTLA